MSYAVPDHAQVTSAQIKAAGDAYQLSNAGKRICRDGRRCGNRAAPHTVLHGDGHPGNVFVRNGKAGLLDWQVVKRGHPSRDLAYSLITGMTTEERQANQRELLDVYRQALAAKRRSRARS